MRALSDLEWVLSVSPESYLRLRCDLSALATLSAQYGDFANLYRKIADFDWTATDDLIKITCTDPERYEEVKRSLFTFRGIEVFRTLVTPQLLTFIERIAGGDESENDEPSDPITLATFVERMFKIGAGWLEWSPEDVWNATPAEILLARDGLIEKLKMIHGSADADKQGDRKPINGSNGFSAADRNRLNALGDYNVKTMAEVPA